MIDVGAYGKDSDVGVLANWAIYESIINGKLALLGDKLLLNGDFEAPFVFVGDEAFPLRTYRMRPLPATRHENNTSAWQ